MSKDGQPIVAGGRHAEYHVWMARAAEGDAFIEAALDRVAAECPGRTLTFRYLPPNAPRTWLGSSRGIAGRCVLIPARRGVMDLTEASTEAALRKKGHRERLRHLERFGPVVYERVTDPQQIDALLDAIIPLCDLRHGALHDVMPFADDPLKAPFHRALARVPGVLYVSVLRCGDQIACAGFDADNRGQVALGFAAFSPRLSRYSPRRAQITTLARDLSLQGYTSIDLTPGADEFKSERATRYDEAYTLHVYFGRSRFALRRAGDAARRTARAMLKRAGADPARLRERLGTWSDAVIRTSRAPALAGLALRRRGWGDDVVDLYRFESDAIDALPAGGAMHRDRFADFAAYRPGVLTPKPRSVFLRAALKRLEHGAHVFTRVDGGELVACGWISGAPVSEGCTEAGHGLHRPPDSALVDDLAAIPRLATSGELVSMLGQIVREAAGLPGVEYVLVAAPSSQPEVRRGAPPPCGGPPPT